MITLVDIGIHIINLILATAQHQFFFTFFTAFMIGLFNLYRIYFDGFTGFHIHKAMRSVFKIQINFCLGIMHMKKAPLRVCCSVNAAMPQTAPPAVPVCPAYH